MVIKRVDSKILLEDVELVLDGELVLEGGYHLLNVHWGPKVFRAEYEEK